MLGMELQVLVNEGRDEEEAVIVAFLVSEGIMQSPVSLLVITYSQERERGGEREREEEERERGLRKSRALFGCGLMESFWQQLLLLEEFVVCPLMAKRISKGA